MVEKKMVSESIIMPMEIFMKDNGKMMQNREEES